MAATKRIPIKKSLYKALKYITASEKTDSEILVTGLNGCSSDSKSAFIQMRLSKHLFEKKDRIQAHHFIQSFVPGEVPFEVAHEIGIKWANEIFGENFQGILSTHIDREHIHNHIIINSVSHKDGRKYDANKGEYKFIRDKSDQLCSEYNLSIISNEKSKLKDRNQRKSQKEYQEFWKEEQTKKQTTIKQDIDTTISVSKDFEDFISKMKKQGYEIKYGKNIKHISFKKLGSKSVRGTTIGEEYSEENIKKRIENRDISSLHSSKYKRQSLDANPNVKVVTINRKLINTTYENYYYTKLPGHKKYIKYDKSEADILNKNTLSVSIDLNKEYTIYDEENEIRIPGIKLFEYYDDKTNEFQNSNENYSSNESKNDIYNTYNTYSKKPKRYTCKNNNIFLKNKKHYKKNVFKRGTYRWNYSRPSSRNSLLVLLILLKTKKTFEKKNINIPAIRKVSNQRILDNNIKNIQTNLNLLNKYHFQNIVDISNAISNIEEKKSYNFKQIKLTEEKYRKNKRVADLIQNYIKHKPAYV